MKRALAVLALVLTTGAGPTGKYPPLAMIDQPLPQVPQHQNESEHGSPLTEYSPAPVPDIEQFRPIPPTPPSGATFSPGLFHPYKTRDSDGYTPNSSVEEEQQKHWKPTPGFNLSVPLE